MAYKFKGKMYPTKADAMAAKDKMKKANKALGKDKTKFGDSLFKKKSNKLPMSNVDSGRFGKDSARQKILNKESMFKADRAIKAAKRDTAKTQISDRSFKSTFDDATKAGKSVFTYGGNKFMTNKGKAENKDKMKTRIAPKGSIKKKSNLDADTVASYKKRIKYMKDRKAKGKNFSAKNLKELEAKLAAN